jgi:hypothetical protein
LYIVSACSSAGVLYLIYIMTSLTPLFSSLEEVRSFVASLTPDSREHVALTPMLLLLIITLPPVLLYVKKVSAWWDPTCAAPARVYCTAAQAAAAEP